MRNSTGVGAYARHQPTTPNGTLLYAEVSRGSHGSGHAEGFDPSAGSCDVPAESHMISYISIVASPGLLASGDDSRFE